MKAARKKNRHNAHPYGRAPRDRRRGRSREDDEYEEDGEGLFGKVKGFFSSFFTFAPAPTSWQEDRDSETETEDESDVEEPLDKKKKKSLVKSLDGGEETLDSAIQHLKGLSQSDFEKYSRMLQERVTEKPMGDDKPLEAVTPFFAPTQTVFPRGVMPSQSSSGLGTFSFNNVTKPVPVHAGAITPTDVVRSWLHRSPGMETSMGSNRSLFNDSTTRTPTRSLKRPRSPSPPTNGFHAPSRVNQTAEKFHVDKEEVYLDRQPPLKKRLKDGSVGPLTTTETAKRILVALDKIGSPLVDARATAPQSRDTPMRLNRGQQSGDLKPRKLSRHPGSRSAAKLTKAAPKPLELTDFATEDYEELEQEEAELPPPTIGLSATKSNHLAPRSTPNRAKAGTRTLPSSTLRPKEKESTGNKKVKRDIIGESLEQSFSSTAEDAPDLQVKASRKQTVRKDIQAKEIFEEPVPSEEPEEPFEATGVLDEDSVENGADQEKKGAKGIDIFKSDFGVKFSGASDFSSTPEPKSDFGRGAEDQENGIKIKKSKKEGSSPGGFTPANSFSSTPATVSSFVSAPAAFISFTSPATVSSFTSTQATFSSTSTPANTTTSPAIKSVSPTQVNSTSPPTSPISPSTTSNATSPPLSSTSLPVSSTPPTFNFSTSFPASTSFSSGTSSTSSTTPSSSIPASISTPATFSSTSASLFTSTSPVNLFTSTASTSSTMSTLTSSNSALPSFNFPQREKEEKEEQFGAQAIENGDATKKKVEESQPKPFTFADFSKREDTSAPSTTSSSTSSSVSTALETSPKPFSFAAIPNFGTEAKQPATSTFPATPNFGMEVKQPATTTFPAFSFPKPAQEKTPDVTPQPAFNFGQTSVETKKISFDFGQDDTSMEHEKPLPTTQASAFSFSMPGQTTETTSSSNDFVFGGTPTFSQSSTSPSPSFGMDSTPNAATGFTFSGSTSTSTPGFGFSPTQTTPSSTMTFGNGFSSSSSTPSSQVFGMTSTSQSPFTMGGNQPFTMGGNQPFAVSGDQSSFQMGNPSPFGSQPSFSMGTSQSQFAMGGMGGIGGFSMGSDDSAKTGRKKLKAKRKH